MIKQEWDDDSSRHRLVDTESGERTDWAHYTLYTYLNGYVGYTAYYAGEEGVCTPDAFMRLTAIR